MEILKPTKREQLYFNKLVRKACKQMVARDRRVNRIARQLEWGARRKAYRDYVWDGHHAHVTAMWKHLLATKGQVHVDSLVAVRSAIRKANLDLNGTIKC